MQNVFGRTVVDSAACNARQAAVLDSPDADMQVFVFNVKVDSQGGEEKIAPPFGGAVRKQATSRIAWEFSFCRKEPA